MKTKILSFLSEDIKKNVTIHSKINLIRKIMLLLLLGCLSQYGYSFNPIDPPAKSHDNVVAITPTSLETANECSDLYSVVTVTVVVTIADCPDYDCTVPDPGCNIQLCIYTNSSCNGLPIACTAFNPDTCTYNIDVRAAEGTYLYGHLVCSGCTYGNGCKASNGTVPVGGGTVYINTLKLCPY